MATTSRNIKDIMKDLASYSAMESEIAATVDALKDEVKAYMTEQGIEEVVTEDGKATWHDVIANRFDTSALRKSEWAEIYDMFLKQTKNKRFTFNHC